MNISIKSIAVLLAAGYPCVISAESLGVHLPAAFTGEMAFGCYIALLAVLTMFTDYARREPARPGAECLTGSSKVSCERHRLAA